MDSQPQHKFSRMAFASHVGYEWNATGEDNSHLQDSWEGTCSGHRLCIQNREENFSLFLSVLQGKVMPVICTVLSSMMYARTSGPRSGRSSEGRGCPCRMTVTLALLSPFSPICPCFQSSCLRYPWVESPTGLISTSWRQRLASGVDISDFWGCEDAIAHICTLILLNKNHFQLGFGVTLPQKHAWTRTHIHKECPQPLTYLQPLDTTPRGWKPWVLDKRKGISARSCRAEREQHEGWGKQWDITSMSKKLTFELFALSVTTLLLVDITSSAQQACILPFSYNNCSSFLFPDLVSVLDMVKKKRLCSKLPIENESTNAE